MLRRALDMAGAMGNAQLPPQRRLQGPHDDACIGQGCSGFVRQQGGAVTGGHQAFDRIVVIELDAWSRVLALAGKPF